MKHWLIGLVLAVLAIVFLYASSATQQAGGAVPAVLLALFVLSVLGIFFTIAHGSKHVRPNAPAATSHTAPAGPRAEISGGESGDNAWAGWQKTLGVILVGLVGLLLYVAIYIGSVWGLTGWLGPVGVAMTFIMLLIVILLTAGKAAD